MARIRKWQETLMITFAALFFSVARAWPLGARSAAAGAPHQKEPFTLTLEAPMQPMKAGKPLVLRVIVTNTSDHGFSVPVSQGGYDVEKIYRVHVLDERGRPAPPWVPPPPPKGKTILRVGTGHGMGLQPGQSLTDEVNISHVYDLSWPGKYKIWIAEPYYRGPHMPRGLVRSNTVTVTVVK